MTQIQHVYLNGTELSEVYANGTLVFGGGGEERVCIESKKYRVGIYAERESTNNYDIIRVCIYVYAMDLSDYDNDIDKEWNNVTAKVTFNYSDQIKEEELGYYINEYGVPQCGINIYSNKRFSISSKIPITVQLYKDGELLSTIAIRIDAWKKDDYYYLEYGTGKPANVTLRRYETRTIPPVRNLWVQ